MKDIYLDNSATTRISEEALAVYLRVSREVYGNPSSLHAMGLAAERELAAARAAILASLGTRQASVIFTASGTEANNLAIFGRAYAKDRYRRGARIITTAGEHASVSAPLTALAAQGYTVVTVPTRGGELDMAALEDALTPDTVLLTMMMVNNETGALYDLAAVGRLLRARCPEARLHVDATQSYLKLPFTLPTLQADMITLSSHKIEGPKGVGALVVTDRLLRERGLSPYILGGGQEGGMRSGTENVPGIAAFGEAVRIGTRELAARHAQLLALRTYLIEQLRADPALQSIVITDPPHHAPHILSLSLPGVRSETMLHALSARGIYVSSGSACSSHAHHDSSALLAYGLSPQAADTSLRISLSYRNETEDIDALITALREELSHLARVRR